jgi:hypothetical protein
MTLKSSNSGNIITFLRDFYYWVVNYFLHWRCKKNYKKTTLFVLITKIQWKINLSLLRQRNVHEIFCFIALIKFKDTNDSNNNKPNIPFLQNLNVLVMKFLFWYYRHVCCIQKKQCALDLFFILKLDALSP